MRPEAKGRVAWQAPPRASPFLVSLPMALATLKVIARSRQAAGRQPEVPSRPPRPMGEGRWGSAPAGRPGAGQKGRAGTGSRARKPLRPARPRRPRARAGALASGSARRTELQTATFGTRRISPEPNHKSACASGVAHTVTRASMIVCQIGSLARSCKCGKSEAASATPREVHSAAMAVQAPLHSSPHSNGNTASRPMLYRRSWASSTRP